MLYVLVTIWTVIWALIFLRFGFKYGGAAGGLFTLIVVDPILVLLTLGVYRMVLELFMVVFRMHEELKAIREQRRELKPGNFSAAVRPQPSADLHSV